MKNTDGKYLVKRNYRLFKKHFVKHIKFRSKTIFSTEFFTIFYHCFDLLYVPKWHGGEKIQLVQTITQKRKFNPLLCKYVRLKL